jgi:Tfp pilus assembly protein PilN
MSMLGVNLIPAPRQQMIARRRRLRRWTVGVIAYGVLLMIGCAVCAAAMSAESDETSQALEKATRQIEELSHNSSKLRPQLTEVETRLSVARLVGDQPDWSLLLTLVGECLDEDIVLSATKLEPAKNIAPAVPTTRAAKTGSKNEPLVHDEVLTLNLQGLARSPAAVTQFVLRLERLRLFHQVTLLSSARQAVGSSETTAFRIECVLHRSGEPDSSQAPANATGAGRKSP